MRVIFFGDIVGDIGLQALLIRLPEIKKTFRPDFVIANGENACKGSGITYKQYHALISGGVDCVTLGNHYRGRDQIDDWIDEAEGILRPLNLKAYFHGVGSATYLVGGKEITITNIMGQGFMKEEVDEPIPSFRDILAASSPIHIVDFHGESTSEKKLFAFEFAGDVSVILGTHTHVMTADAQLLKGRCGFLSDVGFCGKNESIIGYSPASIRAALVEKQRVRFGIDEEGEDELDFIVMDIEDETGACQRIDGYRYVGGKEVSHVSSHH